MKIKISKKLIKECLAEILKEDEPSLQFKEVSEEQVDKILKQVESYNENQRYNEKQFTKYKWDISKNKVWFGAFQNDKCLALCLVKTNEFEGVNFLVEMQTFKKGIGKKLLQFLMKKFKEFYWMSDPDSGDKLVKFYEQFGLKHHTIENHEFFGKVTYFYKVNSKEKEKKLIKFFNS